MKKRQVASVDPAKSVILNDAAKTTEEGQRAGDEQSGSATAAPYAAATTDVDTDVPNTKKSLLGLAEYSSDDEE